jgi:hypothetical protein
MATPQDLARAVLESACDFQHRDLITLAQAVLDLTAERDEALAHLTGCERGPHGDQATCGSCRICCARAALGEKP